MDDIVLDTHNLSVQFTFISRTFIYWDCLYTGVTNGPERPWAWYLVFEFVYKYVGHLLCEIFVSSDFFGN